MHGGLYRAPVLPAPLHRATVRPAHIAIAVRDVSRRGHFPHIGAVGVFPVGRVRSDVAAVGTHDGNQATQHRGSKPRWQSHGGRVIVTLFYTFVTFFWGWSNPLPFSRGCSFLSQLPLLTVDPSDFVPDVPQFEIPDFVT